MGPAVVLGDYIGDDIGAVELEEAALAGTGAAADAGDLVDDATVVLAPVAVQPVTPSTGRPDLDPDRIADRRRILWRDSATILIGVILALLAYQTFVPGGVGGPTGSETPFPSGVSVGTLPPPASLPPGVTFGPIVDPSLGVDATPTPIPVITLGPSPSPSPSPEPTASRRPTPKPTKTAPIVTAPPPPTISPPSDPPVTDPPVTDPPVTDPPATEPPSSAAP